MADARPGHRGHRRGASASRRPGPATRPLARPGQADPLRDPRAGPAGRGASSTCSPAAARRASRRSARGAPAAVFVERDAGAVRVDRARTCERTGLGERAASCAGATSLALPRRRPRPAADGPVRPRPRRPAVRRRRPPRAALERLGEPRHRLAPRRAVVVAKHFWRDAPAGARRAASIRAASGASARRP